MATISKMAEIERCRKKKIGDLLKELYEIHGSQAAVARELEIDQATVSRWLTKMNLARSSILVPKQAGKVS